MATRETDTATAQAGLKASNRVDGKNVTGRVLFASGTYTTTGAEAAGDLIDVVELPFGAIPVPHLSRINSEALGGTGTAIASLGDALDDDRYSATSIALTSAISSAVTPVAAYEVAPRPVDKDTNIIKAKLALSSGSVTSGKKVFFFLAYRKP